MSDEWIVDLWHTYKIIPFHQAQSLKEEDPVRAAGLISQIDLNDVDLYFQRSTEKRSAALDFALAEAGIMGETFRSACDTILLEAIERQYAELAQNLGNPSYDPLLVIDSISSIRRFAGFLSEENTGFEIYKPRLERIETVLHAREKSQFHKPVEPHPVLA